MIEVEIRGRLTEKQAGDMKRLLRKNGKHLDTHTREMILLRGYKGYADNPTIRKVDIRLRNTDGRCEIVLKRKASDNNAGREEIILKLQEKNLNTAKEIAKAFGSSKGLWMHRKKDVFQYRGVEWAIVEAPKKIFFFEAEKTVQNKKHVEAVRLALVKEAESFGFNVFKPHEYVAFVNMLGRRVNKNISW